MKVGFALADHRILEQVNGNKIRILANVPSLDAWIGLPSRVNAEISPVPSGIANHEYDRGTVDVSMAGFTIQYIKSRGRTVQSG